MQPKPLRILIADDSEDIRKGIRGMLAESADWTVCGESADGEDAVKKALQLRPDVILLDLSIPRLRGIEVVQVLRREGLLTRVIIVSQHSEELLARLTHGFGVDHAMPKSRLTEDLIPTLRFIFDQFRKC